MSTKNILKYAEKVHEKFPQTPVIHIFEIWCEQRDIPFSISRESETETVIEIWCKQLANISTNTILKFLEKCMKNFH